MRAIPTYVFHKVRLLGHCWNLSVGRGQNIRIVIFSIWILILSRIYFIPRLKRQSKPGLKNDICNDWLLILTFQENPFLVVNMKECWQRPFKYYLQWRQFWLSEELGAGWNLLYFSVRSILVFFNFHSVFHYPHIFSYQFICVYVLCVYHVFISFEKIIIIIIRWHRDYCVTRCSLRWGRWTPLGNWVNLCTVVYAWLW